MFANEIAYKCAECGATGVKLWREYNVIATSAHLRCAICAGKWTGEDISEIDCNGRIPLDPPTRTDQIGSLVPAVQTPDQSTFYGYTSVPSDAVAHWRSLPTLPLHAEYVVESWTVRGFDGEHETERFESELFYAHESHKAREWAWNQIAKGYFVRMWRRSSGYENKPS